MLTQTGAMIIMALIVGVFAFSAIQERRAKLARNAAEQDSSRSRLQPAEEHARLSFHPRLIVSLLFAGAVGLFLTVGWNWPFMTKLFPWTIAIPIFVLALVEFVRDLFRGDRSGQGQVMDFQFAEGVDPVLAQKRMLSILCWVIGLLAAVWLFGMKVSMTVMPFAYLKFQGRERWPITLALTAVAWLFLRGVFVEFMQLPF